MDTQELLDDIIRVIALDRDVVRRRQANGQHEDAGRYAIAALKDAEGRLLKLQQQLEAYRDR